MKTSRITLRETVMLVILTVLVLGLLYNVLFYNPLQEELSNIASQSVALDEQIAVTTTQVNKKKQMNRELEEILSRPKKEITEFAPYDNKEVVLNMLYGILGRTEDYKLTFTDPVAQEDGTVRRNISMTFTCASYDAAKQVIRDLTRSNWRCLVNQCAITANVFYTDLDNDGKDDDIDYNDIMTGYVDVNLTITFFESTLLS